MIINDETIQLVKEFEGLRLQAYQDAVGVWIIRSSAVSFSGI